MKILIAVLAVVAMIGCNLTPSAQPTPIHIVNSNQNTNNDGGAESDLDIPETTTNNIVNLDPASLVLEVDRRAATNVTVSTPGGVTVSAADIQVTILDPSVAMLSEVIGERLFLRGVTVGATTVLVHAGGATAELSVTVVASP